jgi:hypothetical protein
MRPEFSFRLWTSLLLLQLLIAGCRPPNPNDLAVTLTVIFPDEASWEGLNFYRLNDETGGVDSVSTSVDTITQQATIRWVVSAPQSVQLLLSERFGSSYKKTLDLTTDCTLVLRPFPKRTQVPPEALPFTYADNIFIYSHVSGCFTETITKIRLVREGKYYTQSATTEHNPLTTAWKFRIPLTYPESLQKALLVYQTAAKLQAGIAVTDYCTNQQRVTICIGNQFAQLRIVNYCQPDSATLQLLRVAGL